MEAQTEEAATPKQQAAGHTGKDSTKDEKPGGGTEYRPVLRAHARRIFEKTTGYAQGGYLTQGRGHVGGKGGLGEEGLGEDGAEEARDLVAELAVPVHDKKEHGSRCVVRRRLVHILVRFAWVVGRVPKTARRELVPGFVNVKGARGWEEGGGAQERYTGRSSTNNAALLLTLFPTFQSTRR